MDPKDWKLIGRVGGGRILEETRAGKNKKVAEDSPEARKKKASKPTSDDLKMLDDKWSQRFARLETMILVKIFAVLVEPVQKTGSDVVTSEKPFFYPAAGTSKKTASLVTQPSEIVTTDASPVQATRDVAASLTATQPVEAPGVKMRGATQPVEVPGARPVVHYQPTGTGSEEVRPVDQSLTSKKTVPIIIAGEEMDSDGLTLRWTQKMTNAVSQAPLLVLVKNRASELSDRDTPRQEELDQELSEEAN